MNITPPHNSDSLDIYVAHHDWFVVSLNKASNNFAVENDVTDRSYQ